MKLMDMDMVARHSCWSMASTMSSCGLREADEVEDEVGLGCFRAAASTVVSNARAELGLRGAGGGEDGSSTLLFFERRGDGMREAVVK